MSLIAGAVVGILLGLRFRVLVLVPATVLFSVGILLAGVANGDQFWTVALTVIGAVALLQMGYVAGYLLQGVLAVSASNDPAPHFRRADYGARRDIEYLNM